MQDFDDINGFNNHFSNFKFTESLEEDYDDSQYDKGTYSNYSEDIDSLVYQLNCEKEHSRDLEVKLQNANESIIDMQSTMLKAQSFIKENDKKMREMEQKLNGRNDEVALYLAEQRKTNTLLSDTQRHCDEIMENVSIKAETLIQQATQEAEKIVSEAKKEAERIQNEINAKMSVANSSAKQIIVEAAKKAKLMISEKSVQVTLDSEIKTNELLEKLHTIAREIENIHKDYNE